MYQIIQENQRRSLVLVAAMGLLLALFGVVFFFFSPQVGAIATSICLVLWLGAFLVSWNFGDEIILKAAKAHKLKGFKYKRLRNVVEEVSIAAGIPTPEIYIINSDTLNAFATGKSPETGKVAVTTGLLERLNREELQGVMAHEVAHIYNRDILYMTLLITCVGLIALLAELMLHLLRGGLHSGALFEVEDIRVGAGLAIGAVVLFVLLVVFAPMISQIIYLAASRKREYLADATGVMICRNPQGLASALAKISQGSRPVKKKEVNKALMPLYIANPLSSAQGKDSMKAGWWDTHPPIGARIKILEEMGASAEQIDKEGLDQYVNKYKKVQKESPLPNIFPIPMGVANFQGFAPIQTITKGEEEDDLQQELQDTIATTRQCDYCGDMIHIPKDSVGKKIKCSHCHHFSKARKKPKKVFVSPGKDTLYKSCVYCEGTLVRRGGKKRKVICTDCGRKFKLRPIGKSKE